jgi:hypothetical protein
MLLFEPKSHASADEKAYSTRLERITSRTGWYNETGYLGKPVPDPHHVWFTDVDYVDSEVRVDASTSTRATKARDALGLIDTKDNMYLLSLRFAADRLQPIPGVTMARPGFADRGTRRFAVYLGETGEPVYGKKWGLTVHLGKFKAGPKRPIDGVPERICLAIPLSSIGDSIKVEPLGWAEGTRGEAAGLDDDEAFANRLRGRLKLASIKRRLLTIASKP